MDFNSHSLSQAQLNRNSHNQQQPINQDNNINSILKVLDMSFDQNDFTQKYKNEKIEKDFQVYSHEEIVYFGKVFVIQEITILIIYMIFQTYRLIKQRGVYPNYKWALVTSVLLVLFVVGYWMIMRKIKILSRYFGDICTLVVFVGFIELAIMGNPSQANVDGFTVITAGMTYLAIVSYSQGSLFITYLFCVAYLWGRTYNWIHDDFRYIRFNVFFTQSFVFIYFFSRAFHSRERKRFQQSKEQERLLQLFHNLIRVYHDGILITQDDKVVFHNNQIDEIFSNQESRQELLSQNSDEENRSEIRNEHLMQNDEEKLIHQLQRTEVFQQTDIQTSIQLHEDHYNKFDSIWEYIINHKFYVQDFIQGLIHENPLDGIYFKYKIKNHANNDQDDDLEVKKLQVFTQVLQIDQGNLILTTIRDMSTWLQVEKQRNLSELKTIAFASAAHEFRNPLNAIVSSLSLLENQLKQDARKEGTNRKREKRITDYFTTAKSCSKLMLHLVNDILDFSQIEAKSLILNMEEASINEIVNECVSVLIFKAQSKGLNLEVDMKDTELLKIFTDKNRVVQILINLTSNAIKYTNQGYVKIQVSIDKIEHQLVLKIIDTGVGIADDKIPYLFTPFTKILTNRNLNNEGVGLGLTISKNIAEALGGRLEVESEVNVGSTFTLIIPLVEKNDQTQTRSKEVLMDESYSKQHLIDSFQSHDVQLHDDIDGIFTTRGETNQREIANRTLNFANTYATDLDFNNQGARNYNDTIMYQEEESKEENDYPRDVSQLQISLDNTPAYQLQSSSQMSDAQSQIINSRSLQTCRCAKSLIVDDEPFNLIVLQGLLEQTNSVKVDKSFNGQDALKMINRNRKLKCHNHQPYQVIFLDKNMPIMNGIDTAIEIRKIEKNISDSFSKRNLNSHYILILVTGDERAMKSDNQIIYDGKNLFDEVLVKPIDQNNLQLLLMRYEINS